MMAPDGRDAPPPDGRLTRQMLPVGDGHEIYVETVGTPSGIPAVYLHGGPGSGCQPDHRRLFDPARFHAVLFDQRGAGLSRPRGERAANTTHHLIADMEAIRALFGFEHWLVVGGSWGATLALAYAEQYPQRVSGLVLRATFLGTRAELDWAFLGGLRRFHPQLFDDFLGVLPPQERAAPLEAYWRRILDPDPAVHGPAARAWYDTERALSELRPARVRIDRDALHDTARPLPATPFMEAHYFRNQCFLAPDQLLTEAHRLRGIPGIVIQGRYDLLCPAATAQALVAAWPDAELRIVEGAGHSLQDPGVTNAVTTAISDIVARLPRTPRLTTAAD
ncbi:MAG: prolyl aminopeptidase [Pseudomonadota bacterium]